MTQFIELAIAAVLVLLAYWGILAILIEMLQAMLGGGDDD